MNATRPSIAALFLVTDLSAAEYTIDFYTPSRLVVSLGLGSKICRPVVCGVYAMSRGLSLKQKSPATTRHGVILETTEMPSQQQAGFTRIGSVQLD